MGCYCRICGHVRPNERFSRNGRRIHVCKVCTKIPKSERLRMEAEDEIRGFLQQSNISRKNLKRLSELAASQSPDIAALASVVLEVGRVKPHRRKRLSFLARNHRHLIWKLEVAGLITPREWDPWTSEMASEEDMGEGFEGEQVRSRDDSMSQEFHKIWIEQCDAVAGIADRLGKPHAIRYLIGEKYLHFLRVCDRRPEFAEEIPRFAERVKEIFEPREISDLLDELLHQQAAGKDDDWPFDSFEDAEFEPRDVVDEAETILLIERARELLVERDRRERS